MYRSFPFPEIPGCLRFLAVVPLPFLTALSSAAADQPFSVAAGPIAAGQMPLTWSMKSGRVYELQHSTNLGSWAAVATPDVPTIAINPGPVTVTVPVSGSKHFYRVSEVSSPYDPAWAAVPPLRTLTIGPTATFSQLNAAFQALIPGDLLQLQAGTYTLTGRLAIRPQGTAAAPIRIEAAPGATVLLKRTDASQNMLDMGDSGPARFLAIRGIEFSGGSAGLRLGDCANVWIDNCNIHDTDSSAITANTVTTSKLHITRNELWKTGGTAEGVYLGSSSGTVTTTGSIVALNHIHDTPVPDGGSGAGVFIRQGSSGNLIAANHIHDIGGPGIFLSGTGGLAINTVEGNRCYRTVDDGIFVLADCLLRNNFINVGQSGLSGFRSGPNSGINPTRMTVVNNTFISASSDAVRLTAWELGTGMTFANNVCHSQSSMAVRSTTTPTGTTFSGNIGFGTLSTGVTGFQSGTGLADFVNVAWNASQNDARPASNSPLRGAANATFAPVVDIDFLPRSAPHASGCFRP